VSARMIVATAAAGVALAGCASTPAPVAEMAAARSTVQQAQPAASRYAPEALRSAQAKLAHAEAAMAQEDHEKARRLAEQATLDARLAWTQAEHARMRAAVAEVNQGIQTLKQEDPVKIATVLRGAAAATAAAVLAACATAPERNTSLEQARSAYDAAQSNPHVPRFAPGELNEAAQALNRAEAMWRNEADAERLEHAAYLATQRAHLARETAMIRAADAELARAGGERERTVLAARLRAAEAARDQAAAQAQEA
jgi:hypothetical protein